jgi:hypothetical protein
VFVFVGRRTQAHGKGIDVEQLILLGNARARRCFLRTDCGNPQWENIAVTKSLFC